MQHHEISSRSGTIEYALPTRVIDVGEPGSGAASLHLTEGDRGAWAALSCCWGKGPHYTLEKDNVAGLINGFCLDEIPATIRDAIIVTRLLNLRFLWVDALCTAQNDPQDWAVEASQMSSVYSKAQVTIVAASASSSDEGFLKRRNWKDRECGVPWRTSSAAPGVVVYPRLIIDGAYPHCWAISDRGWTLQEQQLSWRTLV